MNPHLSRRAATAALAATGITSVLLSTVTVPRQAATHVTPGGSSPTSVLAWNTTAATTALAAGNFQVEGLIKLSYVQAAVYDAVIAIEGGYHPYAGHLHSPRSASLDAAVATAARDTLDVRFPTQQTKVDAAYNTAMDAIPDGQAKTDGVWSVAINVPSTITAAAPGGSARSSRRPLSCSTSSTTAPHDQIHRSPTATNRCAERLSGRSSWRATAKSRPLRRFDTREGAILDNCSVP